MNRQNLGTNYCTDSSVGMNRNWYAVETIGVMKLSLVLSLPDKGRIIAKVMGEGGGGSHWSMFRHSQTIFFHI